MQKKLVNFSEKAFTFDLCPKVNNDITNNCHHMFNTTSLVYNGQQIRGLGQLSYPAQRGMYLHATLMISPEREALGVVDAWMVTRALMHDSISRGGCHRLV